MQSISSELKNSLSADIISYYKTILLYRRYYDTQDDKYKYEQTPLDITGDFIEGDSVKWKLDNEDYNVWNISNVTLVFSNKNNKWRQDYEQGYFPEGKLNYASKIVIKTGAVKSDGAKEDGYVFTGYIASDIVSNLQDKTVTVNLSGRFALLGNLSAEDISNVSQNEAAGSDSGTEFTTINYAVGIINSVKKGDTSGGVENATELLPSEDYSVSDLNQKNSPAKITLNDALTNGESLWISYTYWYTDKTLEWIIEEVMTQAEIGDYEISKVNFESVKNIETYDDNTDWENGGFYYTKSNGSENLELSQLAFRAAAGLEGLLWDEANHLYQTQVTHYTDGVYMSGSYDYSPSGAVQVSKPYGTMGHSAYGTWDFKMAASYSAGKFQCLPRFYFSSTSTDYSVTNGYAFQLVHSGGNSSVILYKVTNGSLVSLWSSAIPVALSSVRVRISRNLSGVFNVWLMSTDGVSNVWNFGSVATDNTHTSYDTHLAMFVVTASSTDTVTGSITEVKTAETISTGTGPYSYVGYWQTDTIDAGTGLKNWGHIITTQTIETGTQTVIETRTSTDGVSFDSWTQTSATGEILSLDKRYLQARWNAYADTAQSKTPILKKLQVTYYSGEIKIPVVNLSLMTCRQVIEEISAMCNYELGFDSQDKFIFRPRFTETAPSMVLENKDIKKIINLSLGISRVYNRISVEFGEYKHTLDSKTQNETQPDSIDKYGIREYYVSNGNLIPSDNTDLAYAIAPTVWQYTNTPKKRCTVSTKYILHLELGDIVTVKLTETDICRLWKWGDTAVTYGLQGHIYHNENYLKENFNLYDIDMRIEGIEFDITNWTTVFDLVEI